VPWQVVANSQILAVHAALVHTGQILLIGGDQHDPDLNVANDVFHTRLFDCTTHAVVSVPSPPFDAFCAGHSLLIDGRLVVAGGTDSFPPGTGLHHEHFPGLRDTAVYHPRSRSWTPAAPMATQSGTSGGGRWYPLLLTLADGQVLAYSGHPRENDSRHRNDTVEVYSPSPRPGGTWRTLAASDSANQPIEYYPRAHVLPSGEVLFATPIGGRTRRLRPRPYAWTDVGPPAPGYDGFGVSSVLLPLLPENDYRARVLFVGGAQSRVFDTGNPGAGWQPTAARALAGSPVRTHASAVLLADGKVLVCGGVRDPTDDATAVKQAEIFNPFANTWSVGDTAAIVRNYHSTALLMPDGRVFTAGGNDRATHSFPPEGGDTRTLEVELYSPPYHGASRPQILTAPAAVGWGETFQITSLQGDSVARVAMVRAGSATHAWDGDQRFVGCTFSNQGSGILRVKAPPRLGVAPPGYYLLVAINGAGVPSPGRFVRLAPKPRGSGSLVQGNYGARGNFEFVAPGRRGGLAFWWRNNDTDAAPWSAPQAAVEGDEVAEIPSMLQGNFGNPGNLEIAARVGDRLAFYWRAGGWNGPAFFGQSGVTGNPAMIQGLFGGRGNFELVVPLARGGLAHYWRNNDAPGLPWLGPTPFGGEAGAVDAVALIQGNFGDPGNLEAIARYGTRLALWWRQSRPPWAWHGPGFFFDGAAGVPALVQSRYGTRGHFELVTPLVDGGAAYLRRDNDAPGLPWAERDRIGEERYVAASLAQSNLGPASTALEVILRTEAGENHYFTKPADAEPWSGPLATLVA
jgi:hypothetical protein